LLAFAVLAISPASAGIEKVGFPTERGVQLRWWPRVTVVTGWYHDADVSMVNGVNMIIPAGSTFADAESVIYARAIYKPRDPDVTSVDVLISQDRARSAEHAPGVRISDAAPVQIADGTKLRTLTFFPAQEGNWERVAYGEDGDFYLMFAVSSRTEEGFAAAEQAYEEMVRSYTREP
jgi:hypothetical protein